eukprot:scaffold164020_cov80-Attheya_sp.AAC.1
MFHTPTEKDYAQCLGNLNGWRYKDNNDKNDNMPALSSHDSYVTQDCEEYNLERLGHLHPPTSDTGMDSNSHSSGSSISSSSSSDAKSETDKNKEEGVEHEDYAAEANSHDMEVVEPQKIPSLLHQGP